MVKGTRDRENNEETKTQAQQPSCSSHVNKGTENMRQQNKKSQEKNQKIWDDNHPLSPHPHPKINQPPLIYLIPHLFVITIQWAWHGMAFLAALESASPAFCKMPATFIDSNSPKQWTRTKNQEPKNEILLPKNRIILPWPTYTEPRPKRGRLENQS